MDQSKFLKVVIIILLVINIGTLAIMWLQRPHPAGSKGEIAEYLTRELNFNETQKRQFEDLRNEHHDAMETVLMKDRKMHDAYFDMLQSPGDSANISAMADSLAANRKQIELITFNHFKKVREICDEQQKKKFDDVINNALRMMARPPGR
jgi:protein CpxP